MFSASNLVKNFRARRANTVSAATETLLPETNHQATSVPDFHIDLQVRITSSSYFRPRSSWVWHRVVLRGQELNVSDATTAKHFLSLQDTTVLSFVPQTGHEYHLQENGTTVLTFLCPSATLFGKFESVLRLSALTPHWVQPRQDVFHDLIDVATTIVETTDDADHGNDADTSKTSSTSDTTHDPDTTTTTSSDEDKTPTAADVAAYLAHVKPIYDHMLTLTTKADVLAYLTQLEADYLADPATVCNFASMVHRHNPCHYYVHIAGGETLGLPGPPDQYAPLPLDTSTCPHLGCGGNLSPDAAFDIRIAGATLPCPHCGRNISVEDVRVAPLLRTHPNIATAAAHNIKVPEFGRQRGDDRGNYFFQSTSTFSMFSDWSDMMNPLYPYVREIQKHQDPNSSVVEPPEAITMDLATALLRLDLVAAMARHLGFLSYVFVHFDAYWSNPQVLEASVVRYGQFNLLRAKHPTKEALIPTIDIVLVRNVYQSLAPPSPLTIALETMFSVLNQAQAATAYAETFLLWAEAFNRPYSSYPPSLPAYLAPANVITRRLRQRKWNKWSRLPSRDCRFVGVDEGFPIKEDDQVETVVPSSSSKDLHGAVIGTPWTDPCLQLPQHATVLGSDSFFGWSPWKQHVVLDDMNYLMAFGFHALMLLISGKE
ncbi:Aste57867_1551 [Aphanomyces stellatus]|uniref:Aste57867_1551 protein n=1 Tax=Aphanomyces stellatus TaxID=120398 RepID=A0A485K5X8_9STRA|nr:hypothetical protein As57867_001550 [Aphanomyces stellatus]VFT78765.1 Aste57867_1551 [Aphanomyces stellatus]